MWPEGARPTERRLKELARKHNACRRLGRAIAFSDSDVRVIIECSGLSENGTRRTGTFAAPLRGSASTRALARLTELKRKNLKPSSKAKSGTALRLVESEPRHGAKP